jgi:hypothetical protein
MPDFIVQNEVLHACCFHKQADQKITHRVSQSVERVITSGKERLRLCTSRDIEEAGRLLISAEIFGTDGAPHSSCQFALKHALLTPQFDDYLRTR